MKHHTILITIILGLIAWTAFGADVSGAWTAQVPGRGGQMQEYTLNFKADGANLTGSIVSPRGESPIENGKISGDEISFTQTLEFGGNQMKFLYKGKVSGNEIKFTREREGGQRPPREFTARRKES